MRWSSWVRGEVELGRGGQPVVGEADGHPLIAQPFGDHLGQGVIVFDDEDPHAATATLATGSVIDTRRPPPCRASSASRPPCAAAPATASDGTPYGQPNVIDQGPGMSAADRTRAFDRFWRALGTTHHDGTGLGLPGIRTR
ncbi:hypothetical protein ACIHFD_56700 [Nonomuraea sp. NPDC051941]|uniref:hypothetical protein n=1 Tax=Nonomuraea sp. NPDC051941 TaxID=3364373 RepID=UPI0037C940D0